MSKSKNKNQPDMFIEHHNPMLIAVDESEKAKQAKPVVKVVKNESLLPPNAGKPVKLKVPDFNDPNRPKTCLEVDFPIIPINELSNLEGNAGKPIYQMSKWWARRRSSVFRSLLIAAATEAPENPEDAAKLVWDTYYANHQEAGNFKNLKVLEPFMGGGTTIVEGSRLGFEMTGVDLNPVAWFVVKNEVSKVDPEEVKKFFAEIEAEVKPQILPFYTTDCPRGHKGKWFEVESGKETNTNPVDVPFEERKKFRYEGPEVIYTFWAKHGQCQAMGCNHRTPLMPTPLIAEKSLSAKFLDVNCPHCHHKFQVELGETRMAPGVELLLGNDQPSFTVTTQEFAQCLKDYNKGNADEMLERIQKAIFLIENEPAFSCPKCSKFTGGRVKSLLESHAGSSLLSVNGGKFKKEFDIQKKNVQMYLFVHPEWMKGSCGYADDKELGGYPDADLSLTEKWYNDRLKNLTLVEIRTNQLQKEYTLADGSVLKTEEGNIPKQATFTCRKCGRQQSRLEASKIPGHCLPYTTYTLQCHCPECDKEGYNYNGRFFKSPNKNDFHLIHKGNEEFIQLKDSVLIYPTEEIPFSMSTHVERPFPDHGITHWYKMFNYRQLLVHGLLLNFIINSEKEIKVKEQTLGAFQQYLRNQNMFVFWNTQRDTPEPFFSNSNYHVKQLVLENSVFSELGRSNLQSCFANTIEGLEWQSNSYEFYTQRYLDKSIKIDTNDPISDRITIYQSSSTELSFLDKEKYDLVITDPPFGDNINYADLADFFYVWLRIPLLKLYAGKPEAEYFKPSRTPHAMEAVENSVEHPEDRKAFEKVEKVNSKFHAEIIEHSKNPDLQVGDKNPLYRKEPAKEFYNKALTACWREAGRLLKESGILAFTFHHSEDGPWVDVLESLFNAGFILVATYPIRSDESKGDKGQFGSKLIEYDIIHVCRKRDPEEAKVSISWAKLRRKILDDVKQLQSTLEHHYKEGLPDADIKVIKRGKALEYFSRHYGNVYVEQGREFTIQEALVAINLILEDESDSTKEAPPVNAETHTRQFLRIFYNGEPVPRDQMQKLLRGTGMSSNTFTDYGWCIEADKVYSMVDPLAYAQSYKGKNRNKIGKDLDQALFLIGACFEGSGMRVSDTLDNANFKPHPALPDLLKWFQTHSNRDEIKRGATIASGIYNDWLSKADNRKIAVEQQLLFGIEG
jgi:putative DNA methylase